MSKAAPRKPAVKVKTNLTTEVAHELPLKIESEKIYSRLGPDLRPLSFVKYRAILKAASQMFLSQGYGPTSMDAVAEAAGVSKRTVYGHFDTKYALFSAVIQVLCASIVPPSLEELATGESSVVDVLENLGVQFLKGIYSSKQIELYRTIVTDAKQFPELGALMFDGPVKHSEDFMAAYLRTQMAIGTVKILSPGLAAAQFMGMLKTNLHVKLLMKPGTRIKLKEIEDIVRSSVDLFLNGARGD